MSQQHQMAMQGMGVGGPVAAPANAGTPTNNAGYQASDSIKKLNTAIYDYLLCNEKYEAARAIKNSLQIETADSVKQSPGQRQANGIDNGMDVDSKENIGITKRPDDLPAPNSLSTEEGAFLQDWWCQFWELYHGNRRMGKQTTINYVGQQRSLQKTRNGMMSGVDPNAARGAFMGNGGINDLRQAAMKNGMTPAQQQAMQQATAMKMRQGQQNQMQGASMERQGSQMDMNGARSGSPNTGGDAPSPKRQRLDGSGNMQQINQARPGQQGQLQGGNQVGTPSNVPPSPAPISAHTLDLLTKSGLDPKNLSQEQLQKLSAQPTNIQAKSVEVYSAAIQQQMQAAMQRTNSNTNKGMTPNPAMGPAGAQSSPMNQQGFDGTSGELYQNRMGMPPQNGAAVAAAQPGGNGNHALQDYQMQLMLLEQQNKKRLLMARQEQDNMAHPTGVPTGVPGGPNGGQFAPGTSPQGSRAGDPSPNPNDMQRGTSYMNMSPNGDMRGRGSPIPGMIDPSAMNPAAVRAQQMGMGPNGQPMMRPPSSHPQMTQQQQMEMMRNGQMMNGNWQGGPPQMMPGQQPQPGPPGQQPNMTPRQGNMAPPPAPPANQGGTQPSSPSNQPAPPTPNQAGKPKNAAKKAADKKNANNKKGAVAAAAAEDSQAPPTPTPPPPVTPNNPNPQAFNQNKNLGMPNGQPAPGQQNPGANNSQQGGAQGVQGLPNMDPPFGQDLGNDGFHIGDFSNLDSGDVLDNFDFDSFLNNDDQGLGFDANFAFDGDTDGLTMGQ